MVWIELTWCTGCTRGRQLDSRRLVEVWRSIESRGALMETVFLLFFKDCTVKMQSGGSSLRMARVISPGRCGVVCEVRLWGLA